MKFLKAILVGVLCCSAMALNAAQIHGGISLSGAVTFAPNPPDNINTATGFQSFTGVTVASVSGSYTDAGVLAGTAVSMTAFQFNSFPSVGVVPLWQTTAGPAASFNLLSLTSITQIGNDMLSMTGLGTLFLAGCDPTPGRWLFTAQTAEGTFSFSFSNGAVTSVPDGGWTVLLLGGALLGGGALRRKMA